MSVLREQDPDLNIDFGRPNLPVETVVLTRRHDESKAVTCNFCGDGCNSGLTAKVYRPHEVWGKRVIIRTEEFPVYISPCEFQLEIGDGKASVEFLALALPLVKATKDRETSSMIKQSLDLARWHLKQNTPRL